MKIKGLGSIALCSFLILCLGLASGQFQKNAKTVVSNPAGKGYPAVSFNAQAELYLVVWQQRSGSGEDRDVMARVLNRDGSPAGDVVALASTGEDERLPKAASTNSSSWTVVWATGHSIESCSVDATGKAGDFRAITSGSRPVDRPEISSPSPDDAFLVVWEELDETGLSVIKGRRIHALAGTDGEELLLGRSSDHDLRNPSIHQAGDVSFVAWEKHVSVRRVDIEGRLFPSGAGPAEALGNIVPIAADGAQNSFPSVAALSGTDAFFVVWQRSEGRRDYDIAFANVTGRTVQSSGKLTDTEDFRETRPFASGAGIAGRVLVTYQTAPSDNPGTRAIAARTIGWGDMSASAEIALDAERKGGGNPASVRAAGAAGRGLVVWDVKEGEGPSLFAKEWLAEELTGESPTVTVGGPILPLADVAISGMVTLNGAGIENVLLSGFPVETRTNSLGAYIALVPTGWTGTVAPSMPGFTFAPAGHTYTDVVLDMPGENYVMTFVGGVDDIHEDNDDLPTAAVVPQGMTTDLVLRDEDWFRFDVTAEDAGKDLQVRIWATAFPDTTSSRDLDFGILDSSGRLVSYSLSSNSDETAVVCDVAEGSYYIANTYVGLEGTVYSLSVLLSEDFGLGYISGYATDEEGSPIEGATVELYGEPFDWHLTRPLVTTDSDGFYKIAWTPGQYTVRFNQTDFNDAYDWTPEVNYLGEAYHYGEIAALAPGAPLENIDEDLVYGGAISGWITSGAGAPLVDALAYVYASDLSRPGYAYADGTGYYMIDRLRTGNFAVRFRTPTGPMINEWYDDRATFASAAAVGATPAEETFDIDAALDVKTWGTISGHVTDGGGNPISDISVVIYDPAGLALWSTKTNAQGDYALSGIPAGAWKLFFNAAAKATANFISEYYPDVRLLKDAGTVAVAAGEMTPGIDASLAAAGTITGQVNNNVGNLSVIAFDTATEYSFSASPTLQPTGPTTYTLRNLPPGSYKIVAKPNMQGDRIPHWYPDAASYAAAGTVTVAAGGTTAGIDITFSGGGGSISGTVTDTDGYGIPGVTVIAQDATKPTGYSTALTNEDGEYTLRQVPAGQAKVYFNTDAGWLDFISEYHNNELTHALANTVTVVEGETTAIADAALEYRDAFVVATSSLPPGEIAMPYSAQLVATGGRAFYRWTNPSGALPDGLVLSSKGEITGVPTTTGVFDFVVEASDSTAPEQKSEIGFLSITIGAYTGEGYTLTGTVAEIGSPLAGVTLSGLPGSPVTNSAGAYVAVVPSGWSGTVTPVLAGYAFEPAVMTYGNVSAELSGQDYAASAGYRISGTVTLGGAGHSGVLMAGLPGEPRTDATGAYSAMVPQDSTITVTPTLPGFTFSPGDRSYSGYSTDQTGQDFASTFVGGVDDIYEDNEDFASAKEIPMGTTSNLVLRDADWFKFYVPAEDAGKDLRVRLTGTAYPDTTTRRDLDFGILDGTGELLTFNWSASPDEIAYIPNATAGWYYIAHLYVGLEGTVYSVTIDANNDFGLAFVSGTVRDDEGQPAPGVTVEILRKPADWNISHPLVITDAAGQYTICYTPGQYEVHFNVNVFGYDGDDWTPDTDYLGKTYNGGQALTLTAGTTLTGIDGTLTLGGSISGRITDLSGVPLAAAYAFVYSSDTARPGQCLTDAAGNYRVGRLRPGNYAVRFRAPGNLATEWFNDETSFADILPVPVVAGATTAGIDAALGTPGAIAGHVTDGIGNPIAGVTVSVNDVSGIALWTGTTNSSGNYLVGRLPEGQFIVYFNASTAGDANLASQYFPNQRFSADAYHVAVFAGQTTPDTNAILETAGQLIGRVSGDAGIGLSGASVVLFDTDSDFSIGTTTSANGNYSLRNIPPDTYKVRFRAAAGDHAVAWYGDKSSFATADPVVVTAGATVSDIGSPLSDLTATIAGRVTKPGGGGIENVIVVAYDATRAAPLGSAATNAAGDYSISGLPTCSVKVQFDADKPYLAYASEYYTDSADYGTASLVAVTAGETTSGIDAVLTDIAALGVTTASLPGGELAVPYSQTLLASGGRQFYHWTLASGLLPGGLSLNGKGEITGIPTEMGTFAFTVQVTDSTFPQKAATQALSITIGAYTGQGFTISGRVTLGGDPLPGVTLQGFEHDAVTDSGGRYAVVVEPGYWGNVTPVLAGHAFDPPLRTYAVVSENLADQDYTASPGYRVSGTVMLNGAGHQGVLMAGLPTELRTGPSGYYEMMLPAGWDGTVTPTLPGFTFSPAPRTYTDLAGDMPAQDYTSTYAGVADDAFEDNDTFGTAAVVTMGTIIPDLVLRDQDWFKFYVSGDDAGKTLGVRLTATSFPDGGAYADPSRLHDLDYGIMDATGKLIHHSMSGDVDEVSFIPDVAEGWYYIGHTYLINPGMVYSLFVTASNDLPVGTISGRVTDGADQGIDGVTVELWGLPFDWNRFRPMAITDANGNYKIAFFSGDYQIQVNYRDFNQDPTDGYPDGWLPIRNFRGNSYDYNKTVTLVPGTHVTGANVVLEAGGTISGRVTDGQGNPVNQAIVFAHTAGGGRASYAYTDADGNYAIRRLRTANYAVLFRPPTGGALGREWYDDRASFAESAHVAVMAGAVTAGIDAVLGEGASVSGRVTDAEENPIPGVQVTAHDVSGIALQSATTQADGTYLISRLPGGSVKLLFNASPCLAGNYLSEWNADKGSLELADPVTVAVGQTTTDIDAVLAPGGAIAGRLTDGNGDGLLSADVSCHEETGGFSVLVKPDHEGNYIIRNLPAGNYRVRFSYTFYWITNMPAEWYPDAPSWDLAGLVPVTVGQTTNGIDGSLGREHGGISGRVTNSVGAGIAGITVEAVERYWPGATSMAITDANGYYTIQNVPTGPAKVHFNADASNSAYASEYYNGKGEDFESADVLMVVQDTITPDVNAVLAERPALAVTTASLSPWQLGVAFDQQLTATGGRKFYHWSVSGGALPDGLTMDSRGRITGMPTMAGTFPFTARVSDSTSPQRVTTQELSVTIGTYTGEGYTISGTVLFGSQPLAGVVLAGLPGSPVTNSAGGYVAVVQAGWAATVTPTLAGYVFDPLDRPYSHVNSNFSGQDYAATAGCRISGTVTLEGAVLVGVMMSGLPGSPVTGIYGDYNGIVPVGWSGTVTPTLEGYTFVPESRAYTGIAASIPGEDYVAIVARTAVRVDFNGDGREDIVWRHFGEGPDRGAVLVWFMPEDGAALSQRLGVAQNTTGVANLITKSDAIKTHMIRVDIGSQPIAGVPNKKYLTPLDARDSRMGKPTKSFRTPLGVGKPPTREATKRITRNREDRGRYLPSMISGRAGNRQLTEDISRYEKEIPALAGSPGTTRLASLDPSGQAYLYTVQDLNWEIAGFGDFDGNRRTDVLWRYNGAGEGQGSIILWYMDGTSVTSQGYPYGVSDLDWRIDRTGDFNGDGKADILWRYHGAGEGQGTAVIWYMDGTTIIGQDMPYRVSDMDWRIEGIGDFNGDGKADMLWRYYGTGAGQGDMIIWYMDGITVTGQASPYRVSDIDWRVDGTGDFDGDGKTDLLWRYYGAGEGQGTTIIWYMDGSTVKGQEFPYRVTDTNWRIVNR